MERKSTLVDSVSAEPEVSAVGRKRLSLTVIPQNKANRLRNVSCEPVYAAPLARRSQSPTRRRATLNSSLLTAFAVLLCLFFGGKAWGQQTLIVADQTGTNSEIPFYGLYSDDNYQHTQTIYPSTMLTAMQGGTITKLTYHLSTSVTKNYGSTYEIRLGTTTNTAFSNSSSITYLSDANTLVYSNTLNVSGTTVDFELSTPYTYNGGNLVIDVRITTLGSGYSSTYFLGESGSTYYSVKNRNTSSMPTTGTGVSFMPKTTFTYLPTTPYISLSPSSATILTGSTQSLTATYGNVSGTPSITYSSSNTGVATVTGSGTSATVTGVAAGTATITATMTYQGNNYTSTCAITVEDPSYCEPEFSDPDDDYISNFATSGGTTNINNTSDYVSSGYSDYYNNNSVSIEAGATLTCTVTSSSTQWEYGHAIWVDWNKDYEFTSDERVAYTSSTATGNWTGSFVVPANIAAGDYRMRVIHLYDETPTDPCMSDDFGEAEDYKLTVTSSCLAPTNFHASEVGVNSVTVEWNPNGGTKWRIFWTTSDNTSWTNPNESGIISPDDNTYAITGLVTGTTYMFRIFGYCGSDDIAEINDPSNYSTSIDITATPSCPVPTGLTASNVTPNSAELSWTGTADSYNVRYRVPAHDEVIFFDGFESGDLSNWETYAVDYTSSATDWHAFEWDQSYEGNYVAFSRSYDGSTDRSVKNWLITPQVTLDGFVKFYMKDDGTWHDKIYVLVSTGGDFSMLPEQPGSATSTWTEYSADLSSYVGQQGYIAIYHEDEGNNYIAIDDFGIYRSVAASGWVETTTSENSITINGLASETEYEWQVQSDCGSDGESSWSQIATFTTLSPCATPIGLTAEVSNNSASISWSGFTNTYNVQYCETDPTAPATIILNVPTDIWGDGTGYQLILDANHNTYGSTIPSTGNFTAGTFADFENTIPENAVCNASTNTIVLNGSASITIPAGVYDYAFLNPDPSSGTYYIAASNSGFFPGRGDDYEFEAGMTYEFVLSLSGGNDAITLTKTNTTTDCILVEGVSNPYALQNLNYETSYIVRVQGVNCDGGGTATDWSDPATFIIPPAHTVYATVYPTVGGSITGEGFSNGSGIYAEGYSATLTASANSGYQFVNWTATDGSVVSSNASYTFTVTGDVTYQANFTKTTATQLPWTENFDNGYSCGTWEYLHGEWATPLRWTKAACVTNYSWGAYSDSYCMELRANNSDNLVVLPQFDQPLNKLKIKFQIGRGNTASGYTVKLGYVTDPSDASTFHELSTINTPSNPVASHTQYTCDLTTNNNAPSSSEYRLAIKYTTTNMEDSWYLDDFDVRRVYTIAVSDDPSSSSSSLSGDGKYDHGANCTVTATAGDCYNFVNWTENGSEVSTDASYSFTATADRNLVANFEEWTLSLGNTPASLECINSGTEVVLTATATAVASTTYSWAASSGSTTGTDSDNTYTVSPTALSNTYTVSATVGGCERTQTATVTTKPVITSVSSSAGNEFCLGVSTDLSVESNASSFTWDNDAGSGTPVTVTPTATTTYKVSATSGSCESTSSITITVNTPDITDYDYIWRGVSDDWNTAENWYMYSEGNYSVALALPSETKNYYIGTGDCLPSSQWPSLSADATIGNVTIDGGSVTVPDGVTLSIAGTISGALTAESGSTIEFVGSSDQTINDSQTFSNVTFSKDGANEITATGGLIVNGTATFTKGIVTGNVTFGSGATVSGASTSSYVNGKVTRNGMSGAFTFPTGTATLYAPFKATSSSASNVSVQYAAGHDGMPDWWNHSGNLYDAGLNHASDRENWQLSASASTELSSIILYWNESDNHSFEEGNEALNSYLNVAAVKRNGFNWQNLGRASIEGDYDGSGSITAAEPLVIEISGAKAAGEGDYFVTFASSNNNLVLPIELTSFTATCDGRSALVEWSTASERNNDYFSLERSDDAINFTEVARVAGAGNSIEPIDYAYNDYGIHGGDNYYRLVQVDYDGTRTVSEVIVANCVEPESDGEPEVLAYPNPFSSELTVVLDNFGNRAATIEVYDMLGKLIYTNKVAAPQNSYETILNLSNLPPATYTVRVSTTDFVVNRNVVKQ